MGIIKLPACNLLKDPYFHYFLCRAALNGHFEVIRVLAAYGADLGKVASDGNTPLHYAARQGFGPICKFLSQRGEQEQGMVLVQVMNIVTWHSSKIYGKSKWALLVTLERAPN